MQADAIRFGKLVTINNSTAGAREHGSTGACIKD